MFINFSLPFFIFLPSLLPLVVAKYDQASCCLLANQSNSFINTPSHPLLANTVCGQAYSSDIPAAPAVFVPYAFCKANCGGIGLSKASDPGQWIAPIVQFILPAVIFSAIIPRRKVLSFQALSDLIWTKVVKWHYTFRWISWSLGKLLCLLVVSVDNLIWIIAIVVGAGPMMIGGLYESLLDHRILSVLESRKPITEQTKPNDEERLELLIITALGNLQEDGHPVASTYDRLSVHNIKQQIQDLESQGLSTERVEAEISELQEALRKHSIETRARLKSLIGAQSDFGTAVGAPVLFYLGAFIFTILDLRSDPSDQDSAISLAYGVEWMVIVHAAIVAGCLLAANNPATSTAIVGQEQQAAPRRPELIAGYNPIRASTLPATTLPSRGLGAFFNRQCKSILMLIYLGRDWILFWSVSNVYDSTFQPVWMWRRGQNKRLKIKGSKAWTGLSTNSKALLDTSNLWWLWIWLGAIVLITLPPIAGAFVSYATPPIGWSCRSLSFIIYAGCQIVLCTTSIFRHLWYYENDEPTLIQRILAHNILNVTPLVVSMFSCIGGTTMQVVGVLRNCFCYVNTPYWLDLPNAFVNLASDTEDARNSTFNWVEMGIVATGFMVATSFLGWIYQNSARGRFIAVVDTLYADNTIAYDEAEDGHPLGPVPVLMVTGAEANIAGSESDTPQQEGNSSMEEGSSRDRSLDAPSMDSLDSSQPMLSQETLQRSH